MTIWKFFLRFPHFSEEYQIITVEIPLYLTKNFEQLKIIEKRLHSNKIRNHYYFSIILLVITFIAPLVAFDIYKSEVLILLASLMYISKPK